MVIYKFPPEGSQEEPSKKDPDYIVIEDADVQTEPFGYQHEQYVPKTKYPGAVRFMTALASILFFFFSFFSLVFLLLYLACAVLTVFQVQSVNDYLKKSWEGYKTLLVFTLGCLLATFNPAFGFGVIVVYFAVKGKKLDNAMLAKIFGVK